MEANKTVVESKSGIQYLVVEVSENGGSIWGTSIVDGRFRGNTRAMNAANVKIIGTATVTHDGSASLVTLDAPEEDASVDSQRAAEPAIEQDLPQTANPRTVNQVAAVVRGLQLRLDKLADTSGVAAFTFEVTGYDRDAVAITLLEDGRQVTSVAAPENTTADALYQLGYRIHREALGRVVRAWVADQESEPVTAWDVRVVSPMDQDRQIRRLVAELGPQGRQLGLNKDHLWAMATDLYNAGARMTDPGSPIQ